MLRNHKFYLNMFWILLLFLVPLPLIVTLGEGLDPIYSSQRMGINFGIFAYVWCLSAIYLATRPKWVDKLIGLPDMYIVHGMTTVFAMILMWMHKLLSPSEGLIETTGEISLYMFTAIIAYSLFFMASWLTNRVPAVAKLKKKIEKVLNYEVSLWIHRLNVVAVVLIYVHIALIDYIRDVTVFFVLVTIFTIFTFASYFMYLANKKSLRNTGKILRVRKLDKSVTELVIGFSKKVKNVKAGDFVFISFPHHKKLQAPHPFSIVNDPKKDGYITLAVDGVGDFTRELENVENDEIVKFSKGYGILHDIVKKSDKNEKFVFIAGGIGLTSLMSLADHFDDKQIRFIYTARKGKEILYLDKLKNYVERPNFEAYAQHGRLSEKQLKEVIPYGENYSYIIAGPTGMNEFYKNYLAQHGADKNKIYAENFSF
ncbi:MAG: iron reductase [Gemella sp.]|nr:iron reductase [Gemella sp.]